MIEAILLTIELLEMLAKSERWWIKDTEMIISLENIKPNRPQAIYDLRTGALTLYAE